jgi:hypothetical protein
MMVNIYFIYFSQINILRQNSVVAQHYDVDARFISIHFDSIDYSNRHKHEMMADSTFVESNKHYKPETWR